MRNQLTSEQTAKFLILMEKFKSKEEFSVFNLWKIKQVSRKDLANDLQRTLSGGGNQSNEDIKDGEVANEQNADGISVNQIQ